MQTKKLMATALILSGWLTIGCQSNTTTAEPKVETTVTVKANQSARIGQDVTVNVTSIQDSRCPANATCIRYGSANVTFTLAKGSDSQTGSLCLGECGQGIKDKDTTKIQLGGTTYQVVLTEVRPYPTTGSSDTKPEAVIQLLK